MPARRLIRNALVRMVLSVLKQEYRYRKQWIGNREIYKKLKNLKNIHKGQRCFIIATGPSLTLEDVAKLGNEITFGLNSCVKLYKHTSWRPTYYGLTDPDVYQSLKDEIESSVEGKVLFNSKIPLKAGDQYPFFLNNTPDLYRENSLHERHPKILPWVRFSGNIERCVYGGRTVVYALIQIAVYMGFHEIYLLGCDCNYNREQDYSDLAQYNLVNQVKREQQKSAGERMIKSYEVAKKAAKRRKVNIYNATRGGMLEAFPRVDFDRLFE